MIAQNKNFDLVLNKATVLYDKNSTHDITPDVESLIQKSNSSDQGEGSSNP